MLRKVIIGLAALGTASFIAAAGAMPGADAIFARSLEAGSAARAPASRLLLAQAQTPQAPPRTEAILRKTIAELREGKPDFDSMEPVLQKAVKEQAASTADIFAHLGALQTLRYLETRDGSDFYRAVYQNAHVTYIIRLSDTGKISELRLMPAFPW